MRLLIMACRPRSAASAAPQALEGYLHWLRANFRAAGALRLDLTRARPPGAEVHVPAPEHGRHAGRLRALQLLLGGAGWTFDRAGWARGLVAASPHLAALHVSGVHVAELPALPRLAHLLLDDLRLSAPLLASLAGLTALRTLSLVRAPPGSPTLRRALHGTTCTNLLTLACLLIAAGHGRLARRLQRSHGCRSRWAAVEQRTTCHARASPAAAARARPAPGRRTTSWTSATAAAWSGWRCRSA